MRLHLLVEARARYKFAEFCRLKCDSILQCDIDGMETLWKTIWFHFAIDYTTSLSISK